MQKTNITCKNYKLINLHTYNIYNLNLIINDYLKIIKLYKEYEK